MHRIACSILRLEKVDHNKWLLTVDGRFVRSDKVVSVWVPSERELDDYMSGIVGA